MDKFKQVDIIVNWMLSLFFLLVAILDLVIGRPELALLSFIPSAGLFPLLKTPPKIRLVLLTIGALAVSLS